MEPPAQVEALVQAQRARPAAVAVGPVQCQLLCLHEALAPGLLGPDGLPMLAGPELEAASAPLPVGQR